MIELDSTTRHKDRVDEPRVGFLNSYASCRLPSEDGDKFVADAYPLPGTPEVKTTEASYQDYARNLGLISEADQTKLVEHYSVARDMRNDIRYKTFIPDYCSEVRGDMSKCPDPCNFDIRLTSIFSPRSKD